VTSVTHGEEKVERLPWVLNLLDDNEEESNG